VYHQLGNAIAAYLIAHISILPASALASFIYALFCTVVISIISYKVVETPFLKLKKKFEVITSRPV
jgi:peptidoglycan/LPS O-acetylase OafA/YrhL